ncbi:MULTISPECIES: hypothetical protein [Streptomyces]|uniref:Uncharacterized protein n=1 Tax=Streptomyces albidoflavus TaxID=1886 RepID=A0AB37XDH8_9ACTN|nr:MULTISPECIES: hypothetical protein [Streptomyces]MYX84300.1 hypothetical protein [Streptomyces sp. SID4915]MCX5457091.1 hypothetical protein [Streptomyces sp. FT1]RZE39909.1 hypothetical protein C0Q91_14600 [Streptomyces albidoflavus]WTD03902.1 hypothetical protein OH717_15710 [Streptomyces albidoflavus]SCD55654.1 hypothetical protein GA0115250_113336 [Streptomyces sp. BvitLS-983]
MSPRHFKRPADLLDAAREMADTGRPALARLLAEEAADRTSDPAEAKRILSTFTGPSLRRRK